MLYQGGVLITVSSGYDYEDIMDKFRDKYIYCVQDYGLYRSFMRAWELQVNRCNTAQMLRSIECIIHDGVWIQKGNMSMFEWLNMCWKILDTLPNYTGVQLVECK